MRRGAAVLVMLLGILMIQPAAHAAGTLITLDESGTSLSKLNVSAAPGSAGSAVFKLSAQSGNVTGIALFYIGTFNATLAPANFTLIQEGDSKAVNLTVHAGNRTSAGVHEEKVVALGAGGQRAELPVFVTVLESGDWSAVPRNASINASVGEAGLLAEIIVNNTGNTALDIRVSEVDPHGLIWTDPAGFGLDAGKSAARPVYFAVPNGTRPGTYESNITFLDAQDNARHVTAEITVPDAAPPDLSVSVSPSVLRPSVPAQLTVLALDDVNVSNAWYRIGTDPVAQLERAASGRWTAVLENLSSGNHTLNVLANDTSGNLAVETRRLEVVGFNFLSAEPSVDFLRFRPGTLRTLPFMESPQPVAVNITLESLTVGGTNATLNVSVQGSPMAQGQTREILVSGKLHLGVIADGSAEYEFSGRLAIQTSPDVGNPHPSISFRGTVGNYTVTLPQVFSVAGVLYDCAPEDRGTYENSTYECMASYRADIDPETLTISIPKTSYDAAIRSRDVQLSILQGDLAGAQTLSTVLVILLVLGGIGFIFKARVLDARHTKLR